MMMYSLATRSSVSVGAEEGTAETERNEIAQRNGETRTRTEERRDSQPA